MASTLKIIFWTIHEIKSLNKRTLVPIYDLKKTFKKICLNCLLNQKYYIKLNYIKLETTTNYLI